MQQEKNLLIEAASKFFFILSHKEVITWAQFIS